MIQSVRFLTIFVTTIAILTSGPFSSADDGKPGDEPKVSTEQPAQKNRLVRFRNGRIIKKGERPITLPGRGVPPQIGKPPVKKVEPRFPPRNGNGNGSIAPPAQGSENKFSNGIIKIEVTDSVRDELADALSAIYIEMRVAQAKSKNVGLVSRTTQRVPLAGKLAQEAAEFRKRIKTLIDNKVLKNDSVLYNRDLDYESHLETLAEKFSQTYLQFVSAKGQTEEQDKAIELMSITLEAYTAAVLKHIRDTQPKLYLRILSNNWTIGLAAIIGVTLSSTGVGALDEGYALLYLSGAGYGLKKYLQSRTNPLSVKTGLLSRSSVALRKTVGKAFSFLKKENISNLLILVDSFWLNVADGIETLAESPESLKDIGITNATQAELLIAVKPFVDTVDAGQGIRNEMIQFKSLLENIEQVTNLSCKDLLISQQ